MTANIVNRMPLIIANLPDDCSERTLLQNVSPVVRDAHELAVELLFCVPQYLIRDTSQLIAQTTIGGLLPGIAVNITDHWTSGPITGVPGEMMREYNARAILGSPQARLRPSFDSTSLQKLTLQAQDYGVAPIICVGPGENSFLTDDDQIISSQLKMVLDGVTIPENTTFVLLGSSRWKVLRAIYLARFIREKIEEVQPGVASKIRIIYHRGRESISNYNLFPFIVGTSIDGVFVDANAFVGEPQELTQMVRTTFESHPGTMFPRT
ncbi:MAG TPA: triose-phosphate isomerase [Patescibacteria group bacterium]|nr:triose-phosphate isomerase [Patescibacteria group bacterium]